MKIEEIKEIIDLDLRPKYEKSRDSFISYTITKMKINNEFLNKKQTLIEQYGYQSENRWYVEHENSSKYQEELVKLASEYFGEMTENGRNGGLFGNVSNEVYKIVKDKKFTEPQIVEYYTVKFEKQLNDLEDKICAKIASLKPNTVEIGRSEHDFNFIIDDKRNFTINTIITGGDVQCIHNRTLIKLHNKVV